MNSVNWTWTGSPVYVDTMDHGMPSVVFPLPDAEEADECLWPVTTASKCVIREINKSVCKTEEINRVGGGD